jgi:hypothetical protein
MDRRDSLVDRRTEFTRTGVVHASVTSNSLSPAVSATTRSVLKGYFQTGSVPTQANFADFIDSCLIPDAQGNVGLGVAAPAAKLDVAGTVNATAFTGSGAGLTGIPVAALTGSLSVPAANVTGMLSASQLPPVSALSGTFTATQLPALSALSGTLTAAQLPPLNQQNGQLTPAQLPPLNRQSGQLTPAQLPLINQLNGVLSSAQLPDDIVGPDHRIDFGNGAAIAGTGSDLQLQAALVVQTYAPSSIRQTFNPGSPGISAGWVAPGGGTLVALHLPLILPQAVLQAGVTARLVSIVDSRSNTPIYPGSAQPLPPASPRQADALVAFPVPISVAPNSDPWALVFFRFAGLHLPLTPGVLYSCNVALDTHVPTGGPYWLQAFSCASSTQLLGCTALIAPQGSVNLVVSPSGVGIGTAAPSQALEVAGAIKCAGVIQTSDARLKTEVAPLDAVLPRLNALTPVTFRWADAAFPAAAAAGPQLGLIAQAVEAVFPELVQTDERGFKAMDYSRLAAALVGATRELAAENAALRTRFAQLEQRLARLGPSS